MVESQQADGSSHSSLPSLRSDRLSNSDTSSLRCSQRIRCQESQSDVESDDSDEGILESFDTSVQHEWVSSNAPKASADVESFLTSVERALISRVQDGDRRTPSDRSEEIHTLLKDLKTEKDLIVVPTDKTNSFRVVSKASYNDWMLSHLAADAIEIPRSRLTEVKDEAMWLLDSEGRDLSSSELAFIQQSLESCAVPTPLLFIKDHQAPTATGDFRTRFVVPASNFVSALPKLGYKGIQRIFENNGIVTNKFTIIQSSDLKQKLESYALSKDDVTITSLDAVKMYPSVKYQLIERAVQYFARDLDSLSYSKVLACLEFIKFGMGHTFLTFGDKYYEYTAGERNMADRGLTIGGYESAWLADLAMSFLLEKASHLLDELLFSGVYRDDGILVFDGSWKKKEVTNWLSRFQ